MARRGRRKGGPRYKKVHLSLPKRLYSILNGIAMGDERKLNRLIKGILEEKLQESTVAELEAYISGGNEEEELISTEEIKEEQTV
ncbi:MAG TPA: hypothetical protein EYH48_02970 [Aquifex aeolicus]|uniref:Uncharacterized protein n=1 Tax=Aquifex aeolicus TaxID=63363 RepID=A0A9D0YN99_AQUAO|nr:hypothetical protein [Aquificales bacterium]HIP86266.1 hypothetical protein [Aquifex sp.]HIP98115.1 hypothetical protein [Aquifex aeolicus]HIQ26281.1 hypothetical protein [Aquifex aeolicus]